MREPNPSRPAAMPLGAFRPFRLDRRQPACASRNKNHLKFIRREVSFYGGDFRQDKETERWHTRVCRVRLTQDWRKYARKNRLGFDSRMPRPTSDPKTRVARLRLSDSEYEKLEQCCKATGMSITSILKRGIDKVYQEIQGSE